MAEIYHESKESSWQLITKLDLVYVEVNDLTFSLFMCSLTPLITLN